MLIQSLELKNFTVFENLRIDVSSNINIFIGENGTGKTHLLKALYAVCETSIKNRGSAEIISKCFNENCYLIRDKSKMSLVISIVPNGIVNRQIYEWEFMPADQSQLQSYNPKAMSGDFKRYIIELPQGTTYSATYIPSKDMLTHSKGLLAMSDKYREFPFDVTLTEIIRKANQWTLKQPPELARSFLPKLEEMIDGKIVIKNEEFFIVKNDGREINFAVEAEGFKKIGLLWQLLMNESITPNSILIWDEPEANLNPAFIPKLVECLIELSRNNVQIFLSTHNYILAKYFNVKASDSDSIMFHGLYKINNSVQCESNENFAALKHNAIIRVFDELLDEVYNLDLGD